MRNRAPSDIAIEAMARGWEEIEKEEHALTVRKAAVKEAILRAIRDHGEVAPKAKTMRVLRGLAREIQATFPTETQIIESFAAEFAQQVPRRIGRKIFARSVRYTLRPGAFEAFAAASLGVRERDLFRLAVRRTDGAPRVKVVKLKKAKKAA